TFQNILNPRISLLRSPFSLLTGSGAEPDASGGGGAVESRAARAWPGALAPDSTRCRPPLSSEPQGEVAQARGATPRAASFSPPVSSSPLSLLPSEPSGVQVGGAPVQIRRGSHRIRDAGTVRHAEGGRASEWHLRSSAPRKRSTGRPACLKSSSSQPAYLQIRSIAAVDARGTPSPETQAMNLARRGPGLLGFGCGAGPGGGSGHDVCPGSSTCGDQRPTAFVAGSSSSGGGAD
ncbi:unnamed protein product, partial [Urochloa humidicola]